MTITQLEYVLAVNKYRHFGKAAQASHVTQPTLSMQLQKLEEELGIIIFDRSKNPILPTVEGAAVVKQAAVVVRENKKIFDIIKETQKGVTGEFKLAVIPTISTYLLPIFVQEFVTKFPEVNLIVEEYKTEDIVAMLERDELDAGLLVTPLHNDALIEKVLFYEPFYLFIDPAHPLAKKDKIREEDLSLDEIWLLNKGNCFRDQVLKICSDPKSRATGKNAQNQLRFESGNLETLKNMVMNGSGYTLLPHLAVTSLPPTQKKMIKEFFAPIPTREVSLVYSRSFLKEKIINALEDTILGALPKEIKSLKNKNIEVVEIF